MSDRQSHLEEFLRGTGAPDGDEDVDTLPAMEAPYQAYSRKSNKPEFSLHVLTAAGTIRSFQYAHLDSDSSYTSERIVLRFMGLRPVKVQIEGRRLRELYDAIHHHRVGWVREAPRQFTEEDDTIVTRVTVSAIEETSTTPVDQHADA